MHERNLGSGYSLYGIDWGQIDRTQEAPSNKHNVFVEYQEVTLAGPHNENVSNQLVEHPLPVEQYKLTVYIPLDLLYQLKRLKSEFRTPSFSHLVTEALQKHLKQFLHI